MATKISISRQIQLRISQSGKTEAAAAVQLPDIVFAVGQKINQLLQSQYFNVVLPSGETVPDGLIIATYNNISVVKFGSKSKCKLPVMPVMLPKNIGIFQVSDKEDFSNLFIPMLPGEQFLLQSQDVISDLMGQYGYEPIGAELVFNKNLLDNKIEEVFIRLIVSDVSMLGDYEMLPIPADYESIIVEDLFKQFVGIQNSDDAVDSFITKNKTQ